MSEAFCDDRFSDTSDDVEATLGELRREAKIRQTCRVLVGHVACFGGAGGILDDLSGVQSEDELRPIAVRSDFEAMAFAPVRMPTESVNVTASRSASLESPILISLVSNLKLPLFQHLLLEHHRCSLLR